MSEAVLLMMFFAVLLFMNVPIALCLGISSVVVMIFYGIPLDVFPLNIYAGIGKYTLLAIPFFILAGCIMDKAGISEKLIKFVDACIGHIRGGLAIVCVVVSCIFAAISGSGPATVAALGPVIIPAMISAGYEKNSTSALMAASGSIGIVIPPSIVFVVYSSLTGVSVGKIFLAGFIPGILMGIALIIATFILMRFNASSIGSISSISRNEVSVHEKWAAFKDAIWGLLMPIIILGGIYGGFFTPTEASAVAAVYGLLVGVFIYKSIKKQDLVDIFKDAAVQSGGIMLIVGCASLFAWLCQSEGISEMASQVLVKIGSTKNLFLLVVTIIMLIAGFFLEATSALYIFVPIILPVAIQMGYDLVALGVILTVNMAIGQITPPVGVNLFVACSIADINLKEISVKAFPYVIALLVVLLLITYVPRLILIVPELLGM